MSNYPYLAALLPSLSFGQAEFLSPGQFLVECEKWLTEDEMNILSTVTIDDYVTQDHPLELVSEYCRFERMVRRDIADFVESRRLGHDHKTNMFPTSILKDHTPLEAERRLLRLRWDYVHRQLNVHCGDLHALVIYSFKIQILDRLASFDDEAGHASFTSMTDTEAIPTTVMGAA